MSGDRASGAWTPWPAVPGQLELPVEVTWSEGEQWPSAPEVNSDGE